MSDQPNILIIMSDQHNKHVLGCYGDKIVRTPNLDRLAAQGMRFDNAYTPAPLCVPARMSFMTGRTPTNNQVWGNHGLLDSGIPTWAHVLGLAGYETSLIGRMHFESHDQYHGFENRPHGSMFAIHPNGGTGIPYPSGQSKKTVQSSGKGKTQYQWQDEEITKSACRYIQEHGENQDRPFAAVVGYILPHCPFIAPPELFDYYMDKIDVPPVKEMAQHPAQVRDYLSSEKRNFDTYLSEERTRVTRASYYALCEYTDTLVGKVLDSLDESGLADNTLVIYCSDHGDMAGELGLWTKGTYYEGSVGVPMIARLPGVIPEASTSKALCSIMDLGPTLADIAGAEKLPNWDGISLAPLWRGEKKDDDYNEIFSEYLDEKNDPHVPSRMIRCGPWKLWVDQRAPGDELSVALFNLDEDPEEWHDLADGPEYAEIKKKLFDRVTAGWDPEYIRSQTARLVEDRGFISSWAMGDLPRRTLPETIVPPEMNDGIDIIDLGDETWLPPWQR